jgi:hypothetical protein
MALSMSVGRDYRTNSRYEYVIYENEQIVAREGFFRGYGAAKRAGLKAAEKIAAASRPLMDGTALHPQPREGELR